MKRIKALSVDKISLLTSGHAPAVPKAGVAYSILKFFRMGKIEKKDTSRLDAIIKKLSPNGGAVVVDQVDRLGAIVEKMAGIANDIEKMKKADKNTEANS